MKDFDFLSGTKFNKLRESWHNKFRKHNALLTLREILVLIENIDKKREKTNQQKARFYSQHIPLKEGLNDLLNDLQDQGWHCQEAEGVESSQIDILL